MYQGHLPDGSSVQKHSAGPLYPAVIGVHDKADGRWWFVIYPGKDDHYVRSYAKAVEYAEACNRERAEREAILKRQRAFARWADSRATLS